MSPSLCLSLSLSLSLTHTLEWISFTPHTLLSLSRSCVYRNNVHAPIIWSRGRRSVRGIFRLTDFHLQSSDVTFVWGNEIALQQTVGYIMLSSVHTSCSLSSLRLPPLLYQWLFPLTLFIRASRHKKRNHLPGSIKSLPGSCDARRELQRQKPRPCWCRGDVIKWQGLLSRPLLWQAVLSGEGGPDSRVLPHQDTERALKRAHFCDTLRPFASSLPRCFHLVNQRSVSLLCPSILSSHFLKGCLQGLQSLSMISLRLYFQM